MADLYGGEQYWPEKLIVDYNLGPVENTFFDWYNLPEDEITVVKLCNVELGMCIYVKMDGFKVTE